MNINKTPSTKINLLVLVLCLISTTGFSQITFQRLYSITNSTHFNNASQTSDGGYVVGGYEGDSAGFYFIAKLDSYGQQQWSKRINIPIGIDRGCIVGETNAGGYYMLAVAFMNNSYALNLVVLDASGIILGNGIYAGLGASEFGNQSIHQNSAGEFYISSEISNINGHHYFMAKTDSLASPIWINSFAQSLGDKEHCIDSEITPDGGLISVGGSMFLLNMYIIKIDLNSNLVWAKAYGDNAGNLMTATSIDKTLDGGYIIGGQFTSGPFGLAVPLLMKIDSAGNPIWTKYYGDSNVLHTFSVTDVIETSDGSLMMSCVLSSGSFSFVNPVMIKTDNVGNFQWAKRYSLLTQVDPFYFNMTGTADNGYLISAIGYDNNSGNALGYLIKTDSMANSGCSETSVMLSQTSVLLNVTSPAINIPGSATTSATLLASNNNLFASANCSTVVGDMELSDNHTNFTFFPNPVSSTLTVTSSENVSVSISNMLGEIIFKNNFNLTTDKSTIIDVSSFSSGLYYIKAGNEVRKFIKE